MSRLALLAMALLALVPSIARFQAADKLASGAWVQMCTLDGLRSIQLPLAPDGGRLPFHPSDDCQYCPLLAALDSAVVPVALSPASAYAGDSPLPRPSQVSLRRFHPNGLGSRGPPLRA